MKRETPKKAVPYGSKGNVPRVLTRKDIHPGRKCAS
jgi:hypothetical protein